MWANILHVCFKDEIMKDGSDSSSECSLFFFHYIKINFLLKEQVLSDNYHFIKDILIVNSSVSLCLMFLCLLFFSMLL